LGGLVSTRIGRIGWHVSVAGVVLLGLFGVQTLITVALTGDIPGNFVLFGLGFLLLFLGHLLIAPGLRDALGRAWVLPFVGDPTSELITRRSQVQILPPLLERPRRRGLSSTSAACRCRL
jgi:protein-S-isoprenylcysteine O-methyltransferase Ste14